MKHNLLISDNITYYTSNGFEREGTFEDVKHYLGAQLSETVLNVRIDYRLKDKPALDEIKSMLRGWTFEEMSNDVYVFIKE